MTDDAAGQQTVRLTVGSSQREQREEGPIMRSEELDFDLPEDLIAQVPTTDRSASRLLHYRREDKSISHCTFSDLATLLQRGTLLVFNDAQVLPAKFVLRKPTGGRVEGLFLDEPSPHQWHVLLRNLGEVPAMTALTFETDPNLSATVFANLGQGEYSLAISGSGQAATEILDRIGRMPLPPYIKRAKQGDDRDELDRQRYQTVYAAAPGAVAAPTAGLHFTADLLDQLDAAGVERATITLQVGLGTFKPVSTDTLEAHSMHSERYMITAGAADKLNRAKSARHRIIAVGTTTARVLESQSPDRPFEPKSGQTDIFIHPPYRWKHLDGLITNFHLPRSTLIALVAAMTGLEEQRRIYAMAIAERYRFFSYGDAMLID